MVLDMFVQVQTQLETLDREWAVMYYWSEERGSRMTFIKRDRDFFALVWQVGDIAAYSDQLPGRKMPSESHQADRSCCAQSLAVSVYTELLC